MPKLIACVVIYNKRCEDSLTCKSLLNAKKDIIIIIADNSDLPIDNKRFAEENGWTYLSMMGNKGLSYAYNRALDTLDLSEHDSFVVWFDDDTDVPSYYFDKLKKIIQEQKESSIFVPIVKGLNGVVYSPNERRFFRNRFFHEDDIHPKRTKFNAINSCMAVRLSVYSNYRYDEKLFLDSIDQKFCEDMCQKNISFSIVPIVITQHFFQRSSGLTKEKVWNRYSIRIHDYMYYVNKNKRCRFLGFIKVAAWGVEMSFKVKSLSLLINFIEKGWKYLVAPNTL